MRILSLSIYIYMQFNAKIYLIGYTFFFVHVCMNNHSLVTPDLVLFHYSYS